MATTLHTQPDTRTDTATDPVPVPDNLAEPPLDHSTAGTGFIDPLPPLQDETIPAEQVTLDEAELDEELFWAATRRSGFEWEPTEQQQERALARAADAEFAPVSPERIADLNEQAAVFYQTAYRGSWAQTYLTDRLGGIDLTGDPRTRPGYAPEDLDRPDRPPAPTRGHRRRAAGRRPRQTGLHRPAHRRLPRPAHPANPHHRARPWWPMPTTTAPTVRRRCGSSGSSAAATPPRTTLKPGWRRPCKAGPKYLNTGETVLFAKGDQLYGLAEHADRLGAGATPVIVEGPLDAIAVSLASPDSRRASPP